MSTTRPLLSSLSLVRTNAPPLPGFTCWNSTMIHILLSYMMHMPFLKFAVVTAIGSPSLQFDQFTRRGAQNARAVGFHDDQVFDSNTAESVQIHTRLDGDDRVLGQHVIASGAHAGEFVDVEADPMAQAVSEVLGEATLRKHRARDLVHVHSDDTRAYRRDARLVGCEHRFVQVPVPLRRRSDHDGPRQLRAVAN